LTNSCGQTSLSDSYFTITAETSAETRIERSRFIGTARSVTSKQAAEAEYERVCREYHDATHNCFAYVVGRGPDTIFRYSDDGEPSGTAGKPIYEAIVSREVVDLLVVVTRYFGGIKLGTGGLSRAYRETANLVLQKAGSVERFVMQNFRISFAHEQVSAIMKVLADFNVKPENTQYSELVELTGAIRQGLYPQFCTALIDRTHGRATIRETETAE
jgi:uncharacterized YigZ family protein